MSIENENKIIELCENTDYHRAEDDLKKFASVLIANKNVKKRKKLTVKRTN